MWTTQLENDFGSGYSVAHILLPRYMDVGRLGKRDLEIFRA